MSTRQDIKKQIENLAEDDQRIAQIQSLLNGFQPPFVRGAKEPKMRKVKEPAEVNGKPNPMWFVEVRDQWIDFNTQWFNYFGYQHPDTQSQLKTIDDMAKRSGVDLTTFAPETFSITDIENADQVFEMTVKQSEGLLDRIEKTAERAYQMIPDVKKKSMARNLRKIIEIKKKCRDPIPESVEKKYKVHPNRRRWMEAWKYSHTIRYMLYTLRSNLTTTGGVEAWCEAPSHLVKAAMMISMGREATITHGTQGVLIRIPPRHGKTQLSSCDRALRHILAPYQAVSVVHNTKKNASDRLEMVRIHFDMRERVARRRNALYPGFDLSKKTQDSTEKLVIMRDGVKTCDNAEGNLAARGVHGKVQGITCHELWIDDPSDEKETHEEGTRERTNAALEETWMSRLTSREAFFVYICTTWHPDDYSSRLLKARRQGHKNIAYYGQAAGGPEEQFKAIWPEGGYDSNYLAGRYYSLGPARYAAIYQNNPDSEVARKIKRLHFYDHRYHTDPEFDGPDAEAWRRFFESKETTFYISTDPAGSASKYSNLAGITYAAFGPFRYAHPSRPNLELSVPRLVFLEYWSGTASQHDLADKIEQWERDKRVDKIIIETTGGYHATAEELVRNRGIDEEKVIQKTVPGTNKVKRLVNYAIHIERGDAVFPGEPDTDEKGEFALSAKKGWQPMYEQILRAGSTADNCLTDCVSQQLAEVSYDIHDMMGEEDLTRPVVAKSNAYIQQKQKAFREMTRKPPTPRPGQGYVKFLQGA